MRSNCCSLKVKGGDLRWSYIAWTVYTQRIATQTGTMAITVPAFKSNS